MLRTQPRRADFVLLLNKYIARNTTSEPRRCRVRIQEWWTGTAGLPIRVLCQAEANLLLPQLLTYLGLISAKLY